MRAVIFDLDGVLVDSGDAWTGAFNLALKHFKKKLRFTPEEFRDIAFGVDAAVTFRRYGFKEALQMKKFIYDNFHRFLDRVHVDPNAGFVLQRLRSSGLKLAVVSLTRRDVVVGLLEHYKLTQNFEAVLGGDDVEKPKPAPDGLLKACRLLSVPPSEAVYVGDTAHDVAAATSAGMPIVALTTTHSAEELEGAQHVIGDLTELLEIVEKAE